MITKKPEIDGSFRPGTVPSRRPASQEVASRAAGGNGSASVVGADLVITGNLECSGELQIEGEVQGDIHAQRVVIGEHAHVIGALIAEEVVVRGKVQGSIRGNAVSLQASSRVEGDLFHKALIIEQGAFFEGKSRRSDDPMTVQRSNSVPPPAS